MSSDSGEKNIVMSYNQNKELAIYEASFARILESNTPSVPVLRHTIDEGKNNFTALYIPANGKHVFVGDKDGEINIFDMEKGNNNYVLHGGHTKPITALCATSDNKHLISGSWDENPVIWDIKSKDIKHILKGHTDSVKNIEIVKDNRYVVTGSEDGSLCVCEIETGKPVNHVNGHNDWINSVICNKDDIITGSQDRTVKFWKEPWDTKKCNCYKTLKTPEIIRQMAISSNGEFIAMMGINRVMIYSGEKCIKVLETNGILPPLFISDEHLIFENSDKNICLFDIVSGNKKTILKRIGNAESISTTRDGAALISMAKEKLQFWSLSSGELLGTLHNNMPDFLWTTPPDKDAGCGRFWTNRFELIKVINVVGDYNKTNDSAHIVVGKERENYLLGLNSQKQVMSRINGINGKNNITINRCCESSMKLQQLIPMKTIY